MTDQLTEILARLETLEAIVAPYRQKLQPLDQSAKDRMNYILQTVRRGVPQVEIAKTLGISPGRVSAICRQAYQEEIVTEGEKTFAALVDKLYAELDRWIESKPPEIKKHLYEIYEVIDILVSPKAKVIQYDASESE